MGAAPSPRSRTPAHATPDQSAEAAVALVALGPADPAREQLAGALPLVEVAREARALAAALEARAAGLRVVVVEDDRPDLVFVAHALGAERIAVRHRPEGASRLLASATRAAYALVDLALVDDEAGERGAIRAGADPDRVARTSDPFADRLVLEPPRCGRRRALKEAAASLALDAAELSGAVRLTELLAPDQGVNVVNYHRVLPLRELASYCRPQMAIAAPIFEAQLDAIARRRGFTRVDRVHEPGAAGRVAITFDDGYEDNYRVALPIMQRFSTPACIFVVTNLVGRPDALWWDRLGLALFVYWRSGAVEALPAALPERARALRETQAFEEARAIISEVISDLNGRTHAERMEAVAAAEALVPKLSACRTMLSWEEVRAMAEAGVHFGGHTRNHVPLDELPAEVAREELFGSQDDLEARLPVPQPRVVALPRGRLGALSEDDVRARGIDGVMTSVSGVNASEETGSLFVLRRDGRMLTLAGRHHPAKLRLELTGVVDRLRTLVRGRRSAGPVDEDAHAGRA